MKIYKILSILTVMFLSNVAVIAQTEEVEGMVDSLESVNQSVAQDSNFVGFNTHTIKMMARSYGDSIALRWGVDDYSTWRQLNHYGYNIFRMSLQNDNLIVDTLALGLKPLTLNQMRKKYTDERDTVAYLAMQLMYGPGRLTLDQTLSAPGTIGSLVEVHDEQQSIVGYAMLVAE